MRRCAVRIGTHRGRPRPAVRGKRPSEYPAHPIGCAGGVGMGRRGFLPIGAFGLSIAGSVNHVGVRARSQQGKVLHGLAAWIHPALFIAQKRHLGPRGPVVRRPVDTGDAILAAMHDAPDRDRVGQRGTQRQDVASFGVNRHLVPLGWVMRTSTRHVGLGQVDLLPDLENVRAVHGHGVAAGIGLDGDCRPVVDHRRIDRTVSRAGIGGTGYAQRNPQRVARMRQIARRIGPRSAAVDRAEDAHARTGCVQRGGAAWLGHQVADRS